MLAAGDDRKAEVLFLEALDAETTTFGGCAALLSALRQVKLLLGRLCGCCCGWRWRGCLWLNKRWKMFLAFNLICTV